MPVTLNHEGGVMGARLSEDDWDVCFICGVRLEITDDMRPGLREIEDEGGIPVLQCDPECEGEPIQWDGL